MSSTVPFPMVSAAGEVVMVVVVVVVAVVAVLVVVCCCCSCWFELESRGVGTLEAFVGGLGAGRRGLWGGIETGSEVMVSCL